jgi:diguanylate cyclase (GGDEF)-like protein/PAS domain S-box-containing protein
MSTADSLFGANLCSCNLDTDASELTDNHEPLILIVDDNPGMRQSMLDLLSTQNYNCQMASSGQEALERLSLQQVDLMLLDLNMPGMNGQHVLEQVNRDYPDTYVIIVSGETTFDNATTALRKGAEDFIRKPYAPNDLIKSLRNVLDKRSLQQKVEKIHQCLKLSEQRYRFIVSNSPDIIYMLDQKGRFIFINERATALLGYDPDDMIGRHYSKFVHPQDLEKAKFAFDERRTGMRSSQSVEFRLICHDNAPIRYFESHTITIELNAMGIYEKGTEPENFFGTYGVARDVTERKRAEEVINFQLYHDLLTKLPNRALFRDRLKLAMSQAKRNDSQLAMMYLDMDRFKVVNDSLGHLAGDQLLQTVSAHLHGCLRDSDTLARVGGDEFNLLLPDILGREDAARIAEKILSKLKDPIVLDDYEVVVSFSIGISIYPGDGDDIDQLIKHADMAMYHIKGNGKNGYEFFSDNIKSLYHQHISLEQEIRKGLNQDQFEIYYQPQISMHDNRACGMEALIRWNHPQKGLIPPADFIPVSEESGLIIEIGNWVLNEACSELRQWIDAGHEEITLAVNISASQLRQPNFEKTVLETLGRYQLPGDLLELEITENVLMQDIEQAVTKLQSLAAHGVRVAVDDFGIGYSSLSYLQTLPLHTLKIDRSFINEIQTSKSKNTIVTAIIAMSEGLGLEVVAEGVETEVQLNYLKHLGCHKIQGFLLGRPATSAISRELLEKQRNLCPVDYGETDVTSKIPTIKIQKYLGI